MDQESKTRDPLRLTATLADPTRFAIYQHFLAEAGAGSTAAAVARRFSLHPNVARLHLNRLRDAGLLEASTEKSGRGGRPGLTYRLSSQAVNLTFPPRDFQLLASLALQALASFGAAGLKALARVGQAYGEQVAREALQSDPPEQSASLPAVLSAVGKAVAARGWDIEFTAAENGGVQVGMRHCSFQELAERYPEAVCAVCQGVLDGIAAEYLGDDKSKETTVSCREPGTT